MKGNQTRFIFALYSGWFNQINEDLERIEKEIEEKENRLEQKIFLEKQQEFIELQKEDLKDSKKDRKEQNSFTLVLALGVLVSVGIGFFQLLDNFFSAKSTKMFFISGIFIALFLLLILFIFYSLKTKEFWPFLKSNWVPAIMVGILIIIAAIGLIAIKDTPINIDNSLENSINNLGNIMKNQTITINNPIYIDKELITNITQPTIYLKPQT